MGLFSDQERFNYKENKVKSRKMYLIHILLLTPQKPCLVFIFKFKLKTPSGLIWVNTGIIKISQSFK